jgi:hypothetical protein
MSIMEWSTFYWENYSNIYKQKWYEDNFSSVFHLNLFNLKKKECCQASVIVFFYSDNIGRCLFFLIFMIDRLVMKKLYGTKNMIKWS